MIFTDPQVAAVGHTTTTAADAGLAPRVVDVATSGNAGGSFYGRGARGTSRFLVDEERGVLDRRDDHRLGGAPTSSTRRRSPSSARCRSTRLRHAVPAFPTRSEIWLKLLERSSGL